MDEEELVDGIIEGIPVDNLRMQAKLQSFESAEKVLRVFAGMILPVQQRSDAKGLDKSEAARSGAVKELRCYNCNIKGHWKKDCKLPIREKGTCYGCGSAEHLVAQCPKRKSEDDNNYVRPVEIYFSKGINKSIITEALIDSGSSVSFIKISLVPDGEDLQENYKKYFGLNESQLIAIGKTQCYVKKQEVKIYFDLIIVSDDSMRCGVVLGRDFMKKFDLKIDLTALKIITVECIENQNENTKAELSVLEDEDLVKNVPMEQIKLVKLLDSRKLEEKLLDEEFLDMKSRSMLLDNELVSERLCELEDNTKGMRR